MAFRRPIKEINAEFPAQEQYLDSVQRVAREACAVAGMSRRQSSAVQLAIEEGATNIIRHAYLYEKGYIRLRIVIYKKFIVFSLIDTGRSFQPEGSDRLDLERLVETGRRGGLGFYMIRKIMDSVEYISSGGQNELRMFKRLRPTPAQSAPFLRRLFTLRVKFSVTTFLVVSVIILISFYFTDRRSTSQLRQRLDDTVIALAMTIADQAAGYIIRNRSDVEFDELILSYIRSNPDLKSVALVDSNGISLAHSADVLLLRRPFIPPEGVDSDRLGEPQQFKSDEQSGSYLIVPIVIGERKIGTVHVTYSSAVIEQQLRDARRQTILITAFLLLIGIVGIFLLSNYFVTPIVKITQRVRRFSSGDLETELPLEGAEEFFEIARALNEMTTRLSRDRKQAVERERIAKEIEVASQIQKTLLPGKLPDIPGIEIEAYYRAASMVGGDLYDLFPLGEDRFCLVVADVSGKGVPASLVMSMLRTVIQIQSKSADSPHDTLIAVNEYLSVNMPPGIFVTVQLAFYLPAVRELRLVSAGHNPLLYFRSRTGRIERINPAGMPLGVPSTLKENFSDRLEETSLKIEDGDAFFMYTDGVTESTNSEGAQFGVERTVDLLVEQLTKEDPQPVRKITQALIEQIDDFTGVGPQNDDITLLLARASGRSTKRKKEKKSIESRSLTAKEVDSVTPERADHS